MNDPRLAPCPFCNGGQTAIRNQTYWTGMRNEIIAVEISHFCPREEGQQQNVIRMHGRTEEQAIAAWNKRV